MLKKRNSFAIDNGHPSRLEVVICGIYQMMKSVHVSLENLGKNFSGEGLLAFGLVCCGFNVDNDRHVFFAD